MTVAAAMAVFPPVETVRPTVAEGVPVIVQSAWNVGVFVGRFLWKQRNYPVTRGVGLATIHQDSGKGVIISERLRRNCGGLRAARHIIVAVATFTAFATIPDLLVFGAEIGCIP